MQPGPPPLRPSAAAGLFIEPTATSAAGGALNAKASTFYPASQSRGFTPFMNFSPSPYLVVAPPPPPHVYTQVTSTAMEKPRRLDPNAPVFIPGGQSLPSYAPSTPPNPSAFEQTPLFAKEGGFVPQQVRREEGGVEQPLVSKPTETWAVRLRHEETCNSKRETQEHDSNAAPPPAPSSSQPSKRGGKRPFAPSRNHHNQQQEAASSKFSSRPKQTASTRPPNAEKKSKVAAPAEEDSTSTKPAEVSTKPAEVSTTVASPSRPPTFGVWGRGKPPKDLFTQPVGNAQPILKAEPAVPPTKEASGKKGVKQKDDHMKGSSRSHPKNEQKQKFVDKTSDKRSHHPRTEKPHMTHVEKSEAGATMTQKLSPEETAEPPVKVVIEGEPSKVIAKKDSSSIEKRIDECDVAPNSIGKASAAVQDEVRSPRDDTKQVAVHEEVHVPEEIQASGIEATGIDQTVSTPSMDEITVGQDIGKTISTAEENVKSEEKDKSFNDETTTDRLVTAPPAPARKPGLWASKVMAKPETSESGIDSTSKSRVEKGASPPVPSAPAAKRHERPKKNIEDLIAESERQKETEQKRQYEEIDRIPLESETLDAERVTPPETTTKEVKAFKDVDGSLEDSTKKQTASSAVIGSAGEVKIMAPQSEEVISSVLKEDDAAISSSPASVPLLDRSTEPSLFAQFKNNILPTFPAYQRTNRVGANNMINTMRLSSALTKLDYEQRASISEPVTKQPEQAPVALDISGTRNSRGKLVYVLDDLLSVKDHPACKVLSQDLKTALQPLLRAIDGPGDTFSRQLESDSSHKAFDVELMYRQKAGLGGLRTSSDRFALPPSLRGSTGASAAAGSNIFESSEHIWGNRGANRTAGRDTPNAAGLSRSSSAYAGDWQRAQQTKMPPTNFAQVPLPDVDENSWQAKQQEEKMEGDKTIKSLRRLRALLNKMTPNTYSNIYKSIVQGIETPDEAAGLVALTFEKAITNHQYIEMYANLCLDLKFGLVETGIFEEDSENDFRHMLLKCCQDAYEKNLQTDFVPPEGAEDEEVFEALMKHKGKMKGNLMFVGSLVSLSLLSAKVVQTILLGLLNSRKSMQLEALAAFLPTVTEKMFSATKLKDRFDELFEQVKELTNDESVEKRIRYLLKDAIEQRKSLNPTRTISMRSVGGITTADGFTAAPRTR